MTEILVKVEQRRYPKKSILVVSLAIMVSILVAAWLTIQGVLASVIIDKFSAANLSDSILLEWSTVSETNNVGFYIQRANQEAGPFSRISPYYPTLSEDGRGEEYFWFDTDVIFDAVYFYRLEAIDNQGISQYFGPIPGSLNPELITATASVSRTATLTAPSTGTVGTPAITPTRILPTLASSSTQVATPGNATSTSTPTSNLTSETLAVPIVTSETVTPTGTTTLEPLPTIELIFPATDTVVPVQNTDSPQPLLDAASLVQDESTQLVGSKLPSRLVALIGVVSTLWICLGVLLFILVRKLSD